MRLLYLPSTHTHTNTNPCSHTKCKGNWPATASLFSIRSYASSSINQMIASFISQKTVKMAISLTWENLISNSRNMQVEIFCCCFFLFQFDIQSEPKWVVWLLKYTKHTTMASSFFRACENVIWFWREMTMSIFCT